MSEFFGYALVTVGVGTAAFGYAVASPGSSSDEAKQAFWQAFGPYFLLIGAALVICGLLLVKA